MKLFFRGWLGTIGLLGTLSPLRAQTTTNFVSTPPCRLIDTRYTISGVTFGPPFLAGKTSRDFAVPASSCNVPADALSYSLNITLVPHGPVLYVTAWPAGQPQPNASTLNAPGGNIIANAAIVPAGANGAVSIYVDGDTDLIVDINGYFAAPSTAATDALNQQMGQLNQQVTQANQQGNQLAQQIGQQAAAVGQQAAQIGQLGQQVGQIGQLSQQVGQLSQQVSPLAQQIGQVSQQAALVSQHTTQIGQLTQQVSQLNQQTAQVGQQAAQINQQITQISQVLVDVHSEAARQGAALGAGTSVSGSQNTAAGANALPANRSGNGNTALGSSALLASAAGSNNVALGAGALSSTVSGDSNIAVGYAAGSSVGNASHSIEIGHSGQPDDNGVIRLGTPGTHQSAFLAGITGVTVGGVGQAVLVDENGQLGTLQSSVRYKEDIQDIGNGSDALLRLRPVRFRYKRANNKGEKPVQYGLLAEEVAAVLPQLVVYNAQGEIETVQYHQLPALLLNELQKQHRVIEQQQQELQQERAERRSLLTRLAALERQVRPPR